MKRDGPLGDNKDAKESGDDGGSASPTTGSMSVTSPTTRTMRVDHDGVASAMGDTTNTSTAFDGNSTLGPTAVPDTGSGDSRSNTPGCGKGSGKGSSKVSGNGSGKGSGMLTSIERKKLALVTKNRRNSWNGKCPVKNPTPGLFTPQPSAKVMLPKGLVNVPLSSFSPAGGTPRNDGAIDGTIYHSASVDTRDHDRDHVRFNHDDGHDRNDDRNDTLDQSSEAALQQQRRAKTNRRRSAPLIVNYKTGLRKEENGTKDLDEPIVAGSTSALKEGGDEGGMRGIEVVPSTPIGFYLPQGIVPPCWPSMYLESTEVVVAAVVIVVVMVVVVVVVMVVVAVAAVVVVVVVMVVAAVAAAVVLVVVMVVVAAAVVVLVAVMMVVVAAAVAAVVLMVVVVVVVAAAVAVVVVTVIWVEGVVVVVVMMWLPNLSSPMVVLVVVAVPALGYVPTSSPCKTATAFDTATTTANKTLTMTMAVPPVGTTRIRAAVAVAAAV